MTILSLVQDACKELKLPSPDNAVGSTDENVLNLVALAIREGKELRSKYAWARLTKEFTFATVNGQESYALPDDIDYEHFNTHWDRNNKWRLRGPLTPQEWQERKSGITSVIPHTGFRIKGYADRRIYLEPTPTDARTLVFEYQSRSWILPVAWTTSTVFEAGTYCSNNGIIYYTSAGGTTGATTPVHTTGSQSDGGVTWAYYDDPYERFTADTDTCQIDEDLITLGIKWRWKKENGFEWQSYFDEYEEAVRRAFSSQKGARTLSLTPMRNPALLGPWSIPDSGYGS